MPPILDEELLSLRNELNDAAYMAGKASASTTKVATEAAIRMGMIALRLLFYIARKL